MRNEESDAFFPRLAGKAAADREKLLSFFLGNPDRPIRNSELAAMLGESRSDSWTRRLRELRSPEHGGYAILTYRDRTDLRPDEYYFPRQERRASIVVSKISPGLRAAVFDRDAYTCQCCGLARGQRFEDGTAATVHVAHYVAGWRDGNATLDDCFTLCNKCQQAGLHLSADRTPLSTIMGLVRKLPRFEQKRLLDFLLTIKSD